MEPIHPYEKLMHDRFLDSILSWNSELAQDIYVISLSYKSPWSADAQGRDLAFQGQVNLSYNTLEYYRSQIGGELWPPDVKWNYAYWLREITAEIPTLPEYGDEPDNEEMALRDSWCASLGIVPDGSDETGRPLYDESILYRAIISMCTRFARSLHENNILLKKVGKPIPIIIHGGEYYDEVAEVAEAANPPELVTEFKEWINSLHDAAYSNQVVNKLPPGLTTDFDWV